MSFVTAHPTAIRLLPIDNDRALLAIDGPAVATFNTIIEAQPAYEGALGNTITLALAATGLWVPNIGTLTLTGNAVADETVTIGTTVYTWKAAPTTVAYQVKVGASASASIDNLIAAINLAGTPGTDYGSLTAVHPTVRAYAGAGDTMDVQTKVDTILTAVGTLIATTQTMTNATWGATTLADGTNGTNVAFSVTDTAITCAFSPTYTTVSDFETALAASATASALVRVKTAGTTPLYQLVTPGDVFSATNLAGGGATAAAAPTLATQGAPLPFLTDQAVVFARSVAGSGTMTALIRLWGYSPSLERWYPLGTSATTTQGYLNGGVAMAEIGTIANVIRQAEGISGLRKFSRLYAEIIGALGGTATEMEVYVDCVRASTVTES
jgi:hypothetical protein